MKILIADGNPIVLAGMRSVLEDEDDFEVVAAVERGSAVLPFVARTSPEVVLLDATLPGLDGFACLALLHERHPEVHAVLLCDSAEAGDLVRAFAHGAAGVIVKDIPKGEFGPAIRQAVSGGYASAPRSAAMRRGRWTPRRVPGSAGLTPRETEIVRAVADGLSNREIARSLRIAEPTVKFHLSKVYRRLQVSNRTEVTHWAVATGIADGLRDGAPATA
jgi:DNA-binding NarL/FixJ family response regulator